MKSEPRILYFSELGQFVWRNKHRFFQGGLIGFFIIFFGILFFKEPYYHAQANFHEAKSHVTETASSLQSVLKNMHMSYDEAEAISIMRSNQLLSKVVEDVGFQISLKKSAPACLLSRIVNHLRKEWGKPPLVSQEGRFKNVHYILERPTVFYIHRLSSVDFELLDNNKCLIQKGVIDNPLTWDYGTLTLIELPAKDLVGYVLFPKRDVVGKLRNQLTIKTSRFDSKFLQLSCFHTDRRVAIDVLDAVMQRFQDFLKKNHEQIALSQTEYLQKRQADLHKAYEQDLSQHKRFLEEILKEKGSAMLSQEVEMLEKAKNEYLTRFSELDLASRRFQEIALEHNFACQKKQELLEAQENMPWKNSSLPNYDSFSNKEDFAGVDLTTAQKFYSDYSVEKDHFLRQINQTVFLQEQLEKPNIEFSALSYLLDDPVFQEGIQTCSKLTLQLSDEGNRSTRELERLKESLQIQKNHLREHVEKSKHLFQLKLDLVEQKMLGLQKKALELIEKEKNLLQSKLQEIAKKMENFPEKWSREQQLNLKKELSMQIIEGLTELSESKVVDHNLFHITSKPIDLGDAPLDFASSHLILFSLMGGVLGGFASLTSSFSRAIAKGFPVSSLYLRDRGYNLMGIIDKKKFEKWESLEENSQKVLVRLAHAIQKEKKVALFGFSSFFSHHLAELLFKKGITTLCVQVGELNHGLKEEILPFENHFTMSFAKNAFNLLPDENISSRILKEKKEINCLFINCNCSFGEPEVLGLLSECDIFILGIKQESDRDLAPFSVDRTLCVLQK